MAKQNFYSDEKFADIQMLRYRLNGFEQLTLQQKKYIYYLSLATLCGRDITTDQYGKYNIKIRIIMVAISLFLVLQPAFYVERCWHCQPMSYRWTTDKRLHNCATSCFPLSLTQMCYPSV